MNIALGAVIIFILLLPGFSFYIGLYTGKYTKPAPKFSILESLLIAALFSLLVHLVSLNFIHQTIRFDILLRLVGVDYKDAIQQLPPVDNDIFKHLISKFFIYNCVINLICAILGILARLLILHFNLDWRFSFLRLNNRWFYVFNGYQLGVRESYVIYIDALVQTQEGSFIYTGFMNDFICNGEELDRIYLSSATKRKAIAPNVAYPDTLTPGPAYDLEGDTFCLLAKDIKNLMLRFYITSETEPDDQAIIEVKE